MSPLFILKRHLFEPSIVKLVPQFHCGGLHVVQLWFTMDYLTSLFSRRSDNTTRIVKVLVCLLVRVLGTNFWDVLLVKVRCHY